MLHNPLLPASRIAALHPGYFGHHVTFPIQRRLPNPIGAPGQMLHDPISAINGHTPVFSSIAINKLSLFIIVSH